MARLGKPKDCKELRKDDSSDATTEAIIVGGIVAAGFNLLTYFSVKRKWTLLLRLIKVCKK